MEDTPRLARAGDRHGQFGAVVGEDRQRVLRPAVEQDPGHRSANGPVSAGGQFERLAEDPGTTREVDQAGRSGLRAGDSAGCESFAAGLPGHHEVMTVRIAEGMDRGTERLVGILVDIDQPGQRRGDTEIEPMALGVERVGHRLFDDLTRRRAEPGGRAGVDAATASPRCGSPGAWRRRPARSRQPPGSAGGHRADSVGRLAG